MAASPFLKLVIVVLALCFSIFALTACNKYSFLPYDEKIIGKWSFEDAKVTKGWFKKKNISQQYEGLYFDFGENGIFKLIDEHSGLEYEGKWTIRAISTYNSESSETKYVVFIAVDIDGQINEYIWEISLLTAKKLNVMEREGNEYFYFKLRRR